MPEFITVTNRLGQRMLVNVEHISCIADVQNAKDAKPEFNARIYLISGGDDYICTKESFNTICERLCADRITRQDAVQARPKFLEKELVDPVLGEYARGWNAAISAFLENIGSLGNRAGGNTNGTPDDSQQ